MISLQYRNGCVCIAGYTSMPPSRPEATVNRPRVREIGIPSARKIVLACADMLQGHDPPFSNRQGAVRLNRGPGDEAEGD
jgi:hypothetical protein